jgi:trehalose 6-phosphate phosphatase
MAIDVWRERRDVAARLAGARTLWLASDFDGTLVPLQDHPKGVRTTARARAVLTRLVATPGIRLAVLSGRRLADLERVVGVRGAFLSGLGGLETRRPGQEIRRHVPGRRRLDPALRYTLESWVGRFAGAWLEDKDLCWAIHDRAVSADARVRLRRGVLRRLRARRVRARWVVGWRVIEVMPDVDVDKGVALRGWLGRPRRGQLTAYLGDDANDRPALAEVRSRRGIAVGVGGLRARYALSGPARVLQFLEWLALEWKRSRGD